MSINSQAIAPSFANASKSKALQTAFFIAVGVALITIAAKLKVPLWPNPTPVTMQTLAIFTIAAAYGSRLAVATVFSYLILGAFGAPVFTGTPDKGLGVFYMAGPTGGYLAGFLVMAWITGLAADRGWSVNPFKIGGAMVVGEMAMLLLGALWMGYLFGIDKIIAWGIGPFIVTDLMKLALAACILPAVLSLFRRR